MRDGENLLQLYLFHIFCVFLLFSLLFQLICLQLSRGVSENRG